MVRSSTKSHLDEEDEAEDYDSSSYKGEGVAVKADGKSSEQKPNTHRSKHSETEQRRRSKINERFQILRDLIPQNDQKRDKASFLLEVIEYIQFLQEKLQMYEGTYPGWSQEPAKLIPWKNHHSSGDGLMDHSQVMKNGSAPENVTVLSSVQNSIESDLGSSLIYRALDHSPGSSPAITFSAQMQSNLFGSVERGGMPAQSLQESVSDAENMAYQIQPQLWQDRSSNTECTVSNNSLNGHGELISDNEPLNDNNISRAYSKGVMNTLTQALQFSGVDLSQTKIAVQIDVSKRSNGVTNENKYLKNRVMEQTGVRSCLQDSDPSCKRQRTESG